MKIIDLRSDTVTKPAEAMRKVMARAPVGDDVYGEDPSMKEIEALGAELSGKEAAIFLSSGTQGNLMAMLSLGEAGDGVILGKDSHIYNYERGGLAVLAHRMPLVVDEHEGFPLEEKVASFCRDANVHFNPARVVCCENTHNRGGGIAGSPERFRAFTEAMHSRNLLIHLDGARLWNAAVKHGVPISAYTEHVDSVQLCLSKGLGAPVGSLLCGSREMIDRARGWRKMVGGGMRQAGILAGAGLYALKNNFHRLAEDHENARVFADLLREGGLSVSYGEMSTNMIFMDASGCSLPADELARRCAARGVLFSSMGSSIRYVTHLDVSAEDVRTAAHVVLEEA